jgi:hypothetical protein
VSGSPLALAHHRLTAAVDALRAAAEAGSATDDELVSVLSMCEGAARQLDQLSVATVATLQRRGTFADRGYRSAVSALADLLGWERFEARRRVTVAEHACPRTGLDAAPLPARLPETAQVFAAGQAGLRHVEVIAKLLGSPAAGRLTPGAWAGAEEQLAAAAADYTPCGLHTWGTWLIDTLDQDGPEPDDHPPTPLNELTVTRHTGRPGGRLKGRFDDAALFHTITSLIDARAQPLGRDDDRTMPQRQAEALADICGYVLDHGDVPERGGRRPLLNVLVRLEDLENRCRAAILDFGGTLSPASLRMLACDAAVVPIVLGGKGQPLDVGRATRTVPDGLRRAVVARDQGCAHPGCDRPVSWCECHHIQYWEHLGETKLDNLVLLCRAHHRQVHHTDWIVRIRDGSPEFIPPPWIDPERTPRRKPLPHLVA